MAPRSQPEQLASILARSSVVSPEVLTEARHERQRSGKPLDQILVEHGLLTDIELAQLLAEHNNLELVELTSDKDIDPNVARMIDEATAKRHTCIPIGFDDKKNLKVAISDPANLQARDDVRTLTGSRMVPVVAPRNRIATAIERHIVGAGNLDEALTSKAAEEERKKEEEPDPSELIADDSPLVRWVDHVLGLGIREGASDIHFEPQEDMLRVRFRIDGVLQVVEQRDRSIHPAVTSRLKILSDLDIAERRRPQDGRISGNMGGREIDMRVSTIPSVHGEKVVLRVLDRESAMLDLEKLGFSQDNFDRFEASYTKPYGMILVTGPTGSGKSTTLYSTLHRINRPEVNIITVEDPVEYQLPGISQIPIQPAAGVTFPNALRAILRQDPDIVLVGEMRDQETAKIGMEAAMTGHLVLSTLHTNDAPSAVNRLWEMGVEPFLIASAVDCVVAQRLVRRLCDQCKEPYEPTREKVERFSPWPGDQLPTQLYRPVGCSRCMERGYKGRLAVHEVLTVTEPIQRMVVQLASTEEITRQAEKDGMTMLRYDGLQKAIDGQTSVEEIARVIA